MSQSSVDRRMSWWKNQTQVGILTNTSCVILAKYVTFLSLPFLTYKIQMTAPALQSYQEEQEMSVCSLLAHGKEIKKG